MSTVGTQHFPLRVPGSIKRKLVRFVLWSARPPILQIYKLVYRLTVQFAVFLLRHCRGVISIYICRGIAKNEITPGVSDIDLFIVTEDNSNSRRSVQKLCRILGIMTGNLIDYHPNLVTPLETFFHRWKTSPAWQYRYREGKFTWKLLYGRDVLKELPPLDEIQRKGSCYAEMNHWWIRFVDVLFRSRAYYEDSVMSNVICCKAVSELVNARHALFAGAYRYSRAAGLSEISSPLAEKLTRLVEQRFLGSEEHLVDEVYQFLLDFYQELWEEFEKKPFLSIFPDVSMEVDYPGDEFIISEQTERYLALLRNHIEVKWDGKCRKTTLVKSAFWDIGDILFIIEAAENQEPTVRELADLIEFHYRHNEAGKPRIFLFLRVGMIAFPLTPVIPGDLHRGILTPATMPDVFLQLGEKSVYWTGYTKWYLAEWMSNEQWQGMTALKNRQLRIISGSVRTDSIILPLSPEAIQRAGSDNSIEENKFMDGYSAGSESEVFSGKGPLTFCGSPQERLQQCLAEASRMIDSTSVYGILEQHFCERENLYLVLDSVLDRIHVGFLHAGMDLTFSQLIRESERAGFCVDHTMVSSEIMSHELQLFTGRPSVKTDIFIARKESLHGRSGYVEVFIPNMDSDRIQSFIEQEVGTHIGLTLSDTGVMRQVQDAFLAEGFKIPSFMKGRPMVVPRRKLEAIYFEKEFKGKKIRIEVLNFLEGNQ